MSELAGGASTCCTEAPETKLEPNDLLHLEGCNGAERQAPHDIVQPRAQPSTRHNTNDDFAWVKVKIAARVRQVQQQFVHGNGELGLEVFAGFGIVHDVLDLRLSQLDWAVKCARVRQALDDDIFLLDLIR